MELKEKGGSYNNCIISNPFNVWLIFAETTIQEKYQCLFIRKGENLEMYSLKDEMAIGFYA